MGHTFIPHRIPFWDWFMYNIADGVSDEHMADISNTLVVVAMLIVVDTVLRMLMEIRRFNEFRGVPNSMRYTLTGAFLALRKVEADGVEKRFLMSKDLRQGVFVKSIQYPWFMIASILIINVPDSIQYAGVRADEFLAHTAMLFPVLCELYSIVETLMNINPHTQKMAGKLAFILKRIIGATLLVLVVLVGAAR